MSNPLLKLRRVVETQTGQPARITGRKIYILPTRYGLVFGALLITLLIASINYANNPAFILTFLLTGLFIQAIFHTWRNLLDLSLQWKYSEPVFAGETALCRFDLWDHKGRAHYGLQLGFIHDDTIITDCPENRKISLDLPVSTDHRGIHNPGRLCVETRFPLGLLRAWCYLNTDAEIIVYPAPLEEKSGFTHPSWGKALEGDRGVGSDDFTGHRNYRPGDQLGHIYWKALAGEKGLLVKQFGGDRVNRYWLDFHAIQNGDTEYRLRILAGAIQNLSRTAAHYGLRIPGREIGIDSGEAHRHVCLHALALYDFKK